MTNVTQANRRRGTDWPYSDREMRLIAEAVRHEANPPAQRTTVGAVARPAS